MKLRKTYVDSGVLIAAFRGQGDPTARAMQILDDPTREFASSIYVKLETLPKAIYHNNVNEISFYQSFFQSVRQWADQLDIIAETAFTQASEFGLKAMDALHIAAAMSIDADEFVTTERSTKPIHRVTAVNVVSL